MKIIQKDELLSYGFCEFGTEDSQDRYVARNDLIVEEIDNDIGLSFGAAIALMKQGKKVARKGWRSKGKFLWIKPQVEIQADWCKDPMLKKIAEENGGSILGVGVICLFTPDSLEKPAILNGWTPLQCDMLAEDWLVVE